MFKNTDFSFSRETLKVLTLDFCVTYYMPLRHSFRLLPDDVRELVFSNVVHFTCILTFRRQNDVKTPFNMIQALRGYSFYRLFSH